ncbi:MAG: DUF364 domain-containing protein [Oscillospiraceae bacterium]|jgi:uncharacterized protein (DUF4213/DUF364 family)|nr:DUF364 domain-containing protein [Oscillospiraceae bacterium]
MWELYDALLDGIDENALADDYILGANHAYVRSGNGVGICSSMEDTWRSAMLPHKHIGMPLRELAECIKSWDFVEAELALAAINAYYNDLDKLRALGLNIAEHKGYEDRANDPFIQLQREVRDKNVTVIGHFPYIDQLFTPVSNCSIIEKFNPKDGDYPEQAADYLLPVSDFVLISTYTLVEKSLPRFLELSKNAHVTLVGPACPVTPILHAFGIDDIAGFAVRDGNAARDISLGSGGKMHAVGQKVNLRKVDLGAAH